VQEASVAVFGVATIVFGLSRSLPLSLAALVLEISPPALSQCHLTEWQEVKGDVNVRFGSMAPSCTRCGTCGTTSSRK
jgi:hypothetical protein